MKPIPITLDEHRLRKVLESAESDGGYIMLLSCGHTVWSAVQLTESYCGVCIDNLTERVRRTQK